MTQTCFACGERPATTTDGTVPMCQICSQAVTDKRGVRFEKATKDDVLTQLTEEAEKLGMYP